MECLSCKTSIKNINQPCQNCGILPLQIYRCTNPICQRIQYYNETCSYCQNLLIGPMSDSTIHLGENSYHLREFIGGGGMGEVYRAIEENKVGAYLREVAVKLNKQSFSHDNFIRFRQEAQNLTKLKNPHNTRVYHYGEERKNETLTAQFIVMELLEGSTLEKRLQAKPISLLEGLIIYKQIAKALQEAHQKKNNPQRSKTKQYNIN